MRDQLVTGILCNVSIILSVAVALFWYINSIGTSNDKPKVPRKPMHKSDTPDQEKRWEENAR